MAAYEISLKKSLKRGSWQTKLGDTHVLVPMHGMQFHLDEAVAALGCDPANGYAVYRFVFADEPLDDWCFRLASLDRNGPEVFHYRIDENRLGALVGPVWLPRILFQDFSPKPDHLWVRLEEASDRRIVFLGPVTSPGNKEKHP